MVDLNQSLTIFLQTRWAKSTCGLSAHHRRPSGIIGTAEEMIPSTMTAERLNEPSARSASAGYEIKEDDMMGWSSVQLDSLQLWIGCAPVPPSRWRWARTEIRRRDFSLGAPECSLKALKAKNPCLWSKNYGEGLIKSGL